AAPDPARYRKLVLRLRQRRDDRLRAPACDRNPSRSDLCTLSRRCLEQSTDLEPPGNPRVVHSRAAWLGIEFHAGDCTGSYGRCVAFRSLQISKGTDMDSRRLLT